MLEANHFITIELIMICNLKFLLLVSFGLTAFRFGMAQKYTVEMKSIEQEAGLISRNFRAFFQDADGIMWMGSDEGLNSYDGYRVKSYTVENGALLSNFAHGIAQDADGYLWLLGADPNKSNQLVIQIFNSRTGKATSHDKFFGNSFPMDLSNLLFFRSDYLSATVWLITKDHKIYTYKKRDGVLSFQLAYESPKPMFFGATCPQGFWIEYENSFRLIDSNGRNIKEINTGDRRSHGILGTDHLGNIYYFRDMPLEGAPGEYRDVIFSNQVPLGNGTAKFWEGHRISGFDPYNVQAWFVQPTAPGRTIYNNFLDKLVEFDLGEEFHAFPVLLHFDRFGNGWASFDSKINILKLRKSRFTNYLTDEHVFGVNAYGARGLYVNDQNELFTNGLGASYKIDLSTGKKEAFSPHTDFYESGAVDQEYLKRLSLIADKEGNLWYTDEGHRLFKYEIKTKKFKDFTFPDEVLKSSLGGLILHWSSYIDQSGKLWMGAREGISYLDPNDSTLAKLQDYGDFGALKQSPVYDFYENEAGIWIGASTGLYLMTPEGKLIKRFHTNGENGEKIPFNIITHIREDDTGWFWLATRGGGLVKLNPRNGEYKHWTTADGLSDNTIYATYEDDFGFLWIPSNSGIMRLEPNTFSVSTYLKGDGLIHEEFNMGSHFQAPDGRLFFGNIDGVTSFHPMDFIDERKADVELKVVGLEKQERKTGLYKDASSSYFESNGVALNPGELGFSLQFTLLDFIDSEENTFSYKIDGIDQNWNYIDQPTVRINSLPFGKYTMLVRGQGRQGQWSRELSIPIVVIRPFYLRWWFFTGIGLSLIALIWWRVSFREKRLLQHQSVLEKEIANRTVKIRQQAEELQELDNLKSKFFANVSHELRTPLSLILGPVNKLISRKDLDQNARKDLIRVQENSQQISKLVEEILDLTKLENKKIIPRPKSVGLKSFFGRLYNSFESKATFQDIKFHYSYKGDEHQSFLLDSDMTERVVNNLLSNAFKFTPANGNIVLRVLSAEDYIQVSVSDNGTGISKQDLPHIFERFFQTKDSKRAASGGTGIGLALSKELAETMNGQLIVQSEVDMGSTFSLTLPCLKDTQSVDELTPPVPTHNPVPKTGKVAKNDAYVLVVEDHPDMRNFIVSSLSDDFETMEAGNGIEALAIIEASEQKPELIITDMMMPEMDGMELLSTLRSKQSYLSIPVIMLTARTADEDKLEAFRVGVDDYLIKPFSIDELKARIINQLKTAESRRVANLVSEVNYQHGNTPDDKLEEWLLEVKRITQENVDKVDFNIASVAEAVGLSERQFQRNLKKATGYTPNVYLKEIRLQMARNYLEQHAYPQVSEVSLAVGFTSSPYFSRLYKERFGKTPAAYFLESVR